MFFGLKVRFGRKELKKCTMNDFRVLLIVALYFRRKRIFDVACHSHRHKKETVHGFDQLLLVYLISILQIQHYFFGEVPNLISPTASATSRRVEFDQPMVDRPLKGGGHAKIRLFN